MVIKQMKKIRRAQKEKQQYIWRIKKSRELLKNNPQPDLTQDEKKEIKAYWAQFGIDIPDFAWFQYYYGMTGIKDPRFIPNYIYMCMLLPYYNVEELAPAWKDKNFFDHFLFDIPFPEAIIKNIRGRFVDAKNDELIDSSFVKSFLKKYLGDSVIVKNTRDTAQGKSVKKYVLNTEADVDKLLDEWGEVEDYIIQKAVIQHPVLASFNESSVNIIRVNSLYYKGEVRILASAIRIGLKGKVTDVAFVNGVEIINAIGISPDGKFYPELVDQDGKRKKIELEYEKVPNWEAVVELVKKAHKKLYFFDLVAWDITVDAEGHPVCMEYNIKRPGCIFYQYTNGPFFGEYTDEALEFLKDKKNQEKYIPKWMRV